MFVLHLCVVLSYPASLLSSVLVVTVRATKLVPLYVVFASGECDYGNNSAECGYDSGDCCPCTCQSTEHTECGLNGYECRDPSAACVIDDDFTVDVIENCNTRGIGG